MSKFSALELKRRLSGCFCGGAMSRAIAATTPLFAFQDLGAATLGDAARRPPSRSAQASQAEPQSARPEATPSPRPPPPTPSANAPATAPPPPTNEKNNEIMSTPATVVDGQQLESILGKNVVDPTGEDMGRIVDIIVDRSGQVRAAIIDFGGFLGVGTRKIAVDWRMIRFPADGKTDNVTIDLSRDQLRVAPIFKPGEPVVMLGRPSASRHSARSPDHQAKD